MLEKPPDTEGLQNRIANEEMTAGKEAKKGGGELQGVGGA